MLIVGAFLLGSLLGSLIMAFVAGASRKNMCLNCSGIIKDTAEYCE